jgi:hypothetical protein
MTPQMIFDKVVDHLYTQGKPASDASGCLYRHASEDGNLACAVGALIQDHEYESSMERRGVNYILDTYPQLQHLKENTDLLYDLQRSHDGSVVGEKEGNPEFNWDALSVSLSHTATRHNLSTDVLNQHVAKRRGK